MRANWPQDVLHYLRTLVAGRQSDAQTDAYLLDQFIRQRSESAFVILLGRHGPMVLSVCMRVLRDEHLAEDAFQATFLVLARKADSIRNRDALASWLHGVALRLARKLHTQSHRAEQSMNPANLPPVAATEANPCDEREILDEELQRLPERYRLPIVLCYLEGLTHNEAAAQLGWSAGKLRGLLDRGRERLRAQLVRRGVTVPAVAAGTAIASAAVPPVLAASTLKAAVLFSAGKSLAECGVSASVAALVQGGLQMIGSKKAGLVLALALLASAVIGGAGAFLLADSSQPPDEQPNAQQDPPPKVAVAEQEPAKPAPKSIGRAALVVQTGHDQFITATVQSTDGRWLVTGSYDCTAKLWDLSTGKLVRTFEMRTRIGFSRDITRLALYGDNKWLVVANHDSNISPHTQCQVWELATGKEIQVLNEESIIGLSPDGKAMITSFDETIWLKEVATGKEIRQLGPTQPYHTAFQPDTRRYLVVTTGTMRCVDIDTGKDAAVFHDPNLPGREDGPADFSADGNWLWNVKDKTVRIWDARTGDMVRTFQTPRTVHRGRLSCTGKWLVTQEADTDAKVPLLEQLNSTKQRSRLWDASTGKEIRSIAGTGLLPPEGDGKHLVTVQAVLTREVESGDSDERRSEIAVKETATGKTIRTISSQVQRAARNLVLSGDGKWLVASDPYNTGLQVWDLSQGRQATLPNNSFTPISRYALQNQRSIPGPVLSADGKLVAGSEDQAHVWDLADRKWIYSLRLKTGEGRLVSMALSQDGKWLATAAAREPNEGLRLFGRSKLEPSIRLWNLATGQEVRAFSDTAKLDASLTFSPNGKWLIERDPSAPVPFHRLWEVANGQPVELPGVPAAIAVTDDGKYLALTKGSDVVLRDLATGKDVRTFKGHAHKVTSVAFSADGNWLAAGSGDRSWRAPKGVEPHWEARVWEVATGNSVNVFRHADAVIDVKMTRNGKRLVTSTESLHFSDKDNSIRVWDVASGNQLCRVPRVSPASDRHEPRVNPCVLTGDGNRIIWCDRDHVIRVSDVYTGKDLCRLTTLENGAWLVVDGDGRYDAANDGKIEGVHWSVGTESHSFDRFRDRFHDPGLLAKYVGFNRAPLRPVTDDSDRLRK